MPRTNEAFSCVKIDAQLEDLSWDVLDTNAVRFEERCRSVLSIVAQQSESLKNEEPVLQSLLACKFDSDPVTEGATEEVALA